MKIRKKIYVIAILSFVCCTLMLAFIFWFWIFGRNFYPLQSEKKGSNGIFTLAAEIPEKFTEGGGVACNNKFYVLTGINQFAQTHNSFFKYDPDKDQWLRLPEIPVTINHPNMTALGNKIYVAGGFRPLKFGIRIKNYMFADWNPQDIFFEYDIPTSKWTRLPSMPEPLGASGIAVCNDNIYIAGGINRNRHVSDAFLRYDIKEKKWFIMPSMKVSRDHLRMEAVGNKLYAISGRKDDLRKNCDQMECFDTDKNSWTSKSPVPLARGGLASCVLDNKIYTFGGELTYSSVYSIEQYDPLTDSWKFIDSLPEPRHGICAALVNGNIHLVGGGLRSRISVSSIHRVYTLKQSEK